MHKLINYACKCIYEVYKIQVMVIFLFRLGNSQIPQEMNIQLQI